MAMSLDSSTAANVNRFLHETQLSDPAQPQAPSLGPDPHRDSSMDFGSSPQIDVQIHHQSSDMESPGSDANNNKYKKMLRYVPNAGFQGQDTRDETSTFNGASVPNTFKHKSHPNAQTKHKIGLSSVDEVSHSSAASGPGELLGHHVKTSTMKGNANLRPTPELSGHQISENTHSTPSWMPSGLEDKWEEPVRRNSGVSGVSGASNTGKNVLQSQPSLGFLNSSANNATTFVHNPQNSQGQGMATPMWKKVSKQYQSHLGPGPGHDSPFKHVFSTMDESHDTQHVTKPRQESKSGYVSMSTVSTPVATRDSELHLTQQQIHQLEDMLEKAKNEPDDYQIKGSPLKLFGNEYDTFTKAVLSKFVDKVRSNANSVQRQPLPVVAELPVPQLKIKNFTKSGDYTDQDFMQNANNIFAHLQKKGYQGGENGVQDASEMPSFHQKSNFLSRSQTTATSTPKPQKIQDNLRKESSDLYSYSSGSDSFGESHHPNTSDAMNEYTEIDKTNLAPLEPSRSNFTISDDTNEDNGSYTFDELSDFDSRSTEQSSTIKVSKKTVARNEVLASPSPRSEGMENDDSLPLFESSMSSVKQFMKEETRFNKQRSSYTPSSDNLIRWKRPSQLRLLSNASNKVNLPANKDPRYLKGTVKPGNFPGQYGNMVFDSNRSKWVSNDKENELGASLDSIEDLVSNASDASKSNFKPELLPEHGRVKKQLEVSFHIPSDGTSTLEHQYPDVTNVSEVGNTTFSQSNKELVSLITGSTDQIVWETITSIDLSDKNIDRVENLEQYLPAVKSIDLSKNKLKFVEGLPSALFELDVTRNNLSDMTSFHKFHDLQVVNASYNCFRSFSCVSKNVNLTRIDLMGNEIESLDGFPAIHALTSMTLSRNQISGKVHLNNLELPNLKELNLSENSISSIVGIESLENLRILNVNDNMIVSLDCVGTHKRLKKLLCKFNDLRELKLEGFPYLRILRLDGNALVSITGLKKLMYLTELSAKSQSSPEIVETLTKVASDIASVDLSGNASLVKLLPSTSVDRFYNVNQLNLSAVGLSELPVDFSDKFFNVRELNLSFNKLADLKGLENLKQLKKLQILSNNITRMEDILTGLQQCRKTLKVLDMRLNIINFEFYPYVFSPQELELAKENNGSSVFESPIPIQSLEDIESFTIHYNAMSKSREEWRERDRNFFTQMRKDGKERRLKERLDYETILIGFFLNLKELDGSVVPRERRAILESQM